MKRFVIFCTILVVLSCAVGYIAFGASSQPAVIFDGQSRQIEFENAWPFGNNTQPDLFTNMKELMPGDSVSQEITIGAKNMGTNTVRIHLRAENPNEDYVKLLKTYGHWVSFTVKNGDAEFAGDLENGVVLGTFNSKDKATVTVELAIDLRAGNELQGLIAQVDWVFTAEMLPPGLPAPDIDEDDIPWLTKKHINYIVGYDDGLVKPHASITRAEVATIFFRLLTDEVRDELWSTESIYPDVTEEDWFYVAVCTLTKGGILEGYPDGSFQPNEPITRAELATMITRFDTKFGKLAITEQFPDVEGHWAEEYIEFAATRKYVIGYPDGSFKPEQDITRAETVTMVNRCLQRAVDEEGLTEEYITWPDNLTGTWYYYEILEAANYHEYQRSGRDVEGQIYKYENWTEWLEPIDWVKVEQEWIRIHIG